MKHLDEGNVNLIPSQLSSDKVCEGCVRHQPDEPPMNHSCLLETRIEQAKQYLTVALDEHPKYDVGDIVDAFVDYRTLILGRTF